MVNIATNIDELEEIYRLRYEVYITEQGKAVSGADHSKRLLYDPLDEKSSILYIRENESIVATVRKSWANETTIPASLADSYRLEDFSDVPSDKMCFTSRLVVHPRFRGTKTMNALFSFAYRISRDRKCQLDFCNCAPNLVGIMKRLGYREYTSNFDDAELGTRIPMLGIYEDTAYLRQVRFPFMSVALSYPNAEIQHESLRRHVKSPQA